MARMQSHTSNTSVNETGKVVSHENLYGLLEFIKDTYSADKPDLFWIKAMAERWFETAVFFALNSELKEFPCEETLITQLKGIEGMTNTYGVNFEPSLDYTKKNFYEKNAKSINAARLELVKDFGKDYGADTNSMSAIQAFNFVDKMDKGSAVYVKLSEEAEKLMKIHMTDIDRIWKKVDALQARLYPDATIADMQDIPETQVYFMVLKAEQTFASASESLFVKAKIAMQDNKKKDKQFFLDSHASAKLIADFCASLTAEADKIDQTNTQEESSRDTNTKPETQTELDRMRYEADQGLPHGSIGNGLSKDSDRSVYEGNAESLPAGYLTDIPPR